MSSKAALLVGNQEEQKAPLVFYKLVTKHALQRPLLYVSSCSWLEHRRVIVRLRRKKTVAFVVAAVDHDDVEVLDLKRRGVQVQPIEGIVDAAAIMGALDIRFCQWIERYYASLPGEAYALFLSFSDQWIAKAWTIPEEHAKHKEIAVQSVPATPELREKALPDLPVLTSEQEQIYHALVPKDGRGEGKVKLSCVKGITGSGKSFLYIALARYCYENAKVTLILVPEISLVFQMEKLFQAFFPHEAIILFHSKLTPKKRERSLELIGKKSGGVIIGTRSALYVPRLESLGWIIVDEEHESAFKNSSAPRYHVRQAAQQLAKFRQIPLTFGSATPSLEMIYCTKRGLVQLYELTERYGKTQLPKIVFHQKKTILKHQRERPSFEAGSGGGGDIISPQTINRIEQALEEGGQVLVYINKRGFSSTPLCTRCGFYPQCPNCTVSLTYHKGAKQLRCHYCGYGEVFVKECGNCGEQAFQYPRHGTEQVFEFLEAHIKQAVIRRFDSDVLTTSNKLEAALTSFSKGEVNILVGTQMLAKGHHFPRVNLMVILYPERTLLLPDFRSYERVYRELVQASGRAGRSGTQGEVWVETTAAHDPLFRLVQEGRFDDFYEEEMAKRRRVFFPPFSKLIRLVIRGEEQKDVREASQKLHKLVLLYFQTSIAEKKTQILGPGPCLIERIKRNYRYHLTIKTIVMKDVFAMLEVMKERPLGGRKVFVEIDIDPSDLF